MKRIILFFAVCLGLSVFQMDVVHAENIKINTSTTRVSASSKQKVEQNRSTTNRGTVKNQRTTPPQQTTTTTVRQTVKPRPSKSANADNTKKRIVTTARTAKSTRSAIPQPRTITSRAATRQSVSRATTSSSELTGAKISDIKSKNYSKCKSVYFDCMDEFCANKDADLRRCSCSTRIHEFDSIKKQLDSAEDKMLDFNQRLLLVGLDKEDAAAVNVASEGEIGFSTTDTSASEKLLKKITESLNSSGNSKLNNDLSSVSLSLNMDSAWDSVDSLSGVSTTAKNGVALYNAAQPVCIEMAKEVCSDDELSIAQNSYKLLIQQDCNTVAKSYDAKYNQAIEKIHESSALLDMSRLNAYQQRNSDDILTCKKKILDQMSNAAVCGEDLYKCLDVTGQYINPADGSAFLSTNLHEMTNLLTAPVGSESWSSIPANDKFVSFLNSKKKFLEPAIEKCQDIADSVWKDFLNDALARIKLAQNNKLEQIRRSCTTLVTDCKTNAMQSLEDFDARALSTFEVIADTTVNALCENVQNSCIGLFDAMDNGNSDWATGISEIATDTSYQKILDTCMTVGKDCIIQQCNGTSGNFALCGDYASYQRRTILTKNACWDRVLACVEQSSNLANIDTTHLSSSNYLMNMYNVNDESINKSCTDLNDKACLITEHIWGYCQYTPESTSITTNDDLANNDHEDSIETENKILIPVDEDESTLLSWFAYNTDTSNSIDSCSAYKCPIDYYYDGSVCKRMVTDSINTNDGYNVITVDQTITINVAQNVAADGIITNKCEGGQEAKDFFGNCCASGKTSNGICVPDDTYIAIFIQEANCVENSTVPSTDNPKYYCSATLNSNTNLYTINENKKLFLYCVTTQTTPLTVDTNGTLNCNGYAFVVDEYGNYLKMTNATSPIMTYKPNAGTECTYTYTGVPNYWKWVPTPNSSSCNSVHVNKSDFMIKY